MADDLSFDAGVFMAMSLEERVSICVKLAGRAQALAAAAQGPLQKHYLLIAREWLGVAEEMQQAISSEDNSNRAGIFSMAESSSGFKLRNRFK